MRIAFDGRSLASPVLRGWDRYAVGLVRALVRQGVEVTLFHRARKPLHAPHVAQLGCHVLGLSDLGGLHYEQVAVPWALRRGGFDLFHAPFEHGVPLAVTRPVVLTLHSMTAHSYVDLVRRGLLPGPVRDYLGHDIDFRSWPSRYWQSQVARASHILTPSAYCRDEVIRFLRIAPDRVTVTPLAVHGQFRRVPRAESLRTATLDRLGVPKPFLLYVGGYEPHKNVRGVLETFTRVRAVRPDLALVAVGSQRMPDAVHEQAKVLGLGDKIVFLVDLAEELTDLYDEAELFLSLSWRESFGLPALEALTRGIPVVASSWGATPEVVGRAGRLVDPRDPGAASDAVLELLSSGDDRRLREECRVAAGRFSWSRTAAQTLAVYKSLLRRPRSCASANRS